MCVRPQTPTAKAKHKVDSRLVPEVSRSPKCNCCGSSGLVGSDGYAMLQAHFILSLEQGCSVGLALSTSPTPHPPTPPLAKADPLAIQPLQNKLSSSLIAKSPTELWVYRRSAGAPAPLGASILRMYRLTGNMSHIMLSLYRSVSSFSWSVWLGGWRISPTSEPAAVVQPDHAVGTLTAHTQPYALFHSPNKCLKAAASLHKIFYSFWAVIKQSV